MNHKYIHKSGKELNMEITVRYNFSTQKNEKQYIFIDNDGKRQLTQNQFEFDYAIACKYLTPKEGK